MLNFFTFVNILTPKNNTMRKSFLTILAVFAISISINAQDFSKIKFSIAGDLGVSWAKSKSTDYQYNGISSGYGYGIFMDYFFSKNYAFNTGLYVNYMGGKLKYNEVRSLVTGITERKYSMQYLEIPIQLKLKTNQIGYLSYFFTTGFSTGFRLKATASEEFKPNNSSAYVGKDNFNVNKNISFAKISWLVGIGAEYEVNKSISLFGHIGFNNGLTNILLNNNDISPAITENAIINKLALTVGVIL